MRRDPFQPRSTLSRKLRVGRRDAYIYAAVTMLELSEEIKRDADKGKDHTFIRASSAKP